MGLAMSSSTITLAYVLLLSTTYVHVNAFCQNNNACGAFVTSSFKPSSPKTSATVVEIQLPLSFYSTKLSMAQSDNDNDTDEDEDDEEDDEDDEPLKDGIDSVEWLPSLTDTVAPSSTTSTEQDEVLPLFPLGGIVYTPNSEHVLNIFEPRYRQMYNDILMNGTKRFVVAMSHPEKEGTFAKYGVVFKLQDLKEVSEQTGDQIKYVCNHVVTGRVYLKRVLNPEVWKSRETYLRVEGTVIDEMVEEKEEPKDESISADIYKTIVGAVLSSSNKEERRLKASFKSLVERQHELEEDIRFTPASAQSLAVSPGGGESGLWMTVRLWQSFVEQRLVARQNEMQRQFQKKLIDFLKKEKGLKENELPSAIGFNDLSASLQQEVKELQTRMQRELRPLILESTLTIQKILEAEDHTARLNLIRFFVDAERKRLDAKSTLRGMFAGSPDAVLTEEKTDYIAKKEDVENLSGSAKEGENKKNGEGSGSLFTDEPDAFQ